MKAKEIGGGHILKPKLKFNSNQYKYCLTFKVQCSNARKNGYCSNTDREYCKEFTRMMKQEN